MLNCDTGLMRRAIQHAAIVVVTGLFLAAAENAAADCLPWKSAAPVIAKNSLLPGNVIYQMVQSRTGGQIIHASLCDENGRFFYKLVVLGPKGDVSNVTVDARTGQP
jgi:uncharacterized membrane protein YkoI